MYICPVLLYRCYLSVYSPFLLIVEVHSVARLMPVCGEVGLKPCASCVLTRNGVSLYKSCEKQTIKCTKRALWVTDLPHLHHRHLAYILKVTGHSSCFTWALWDQLPLKERKKKSVWLLTTACEAQAQPLTSLSTNGEFHHADLLNIRNDCLQSMCTVKKQTNTKTKLFLSVYCILRLSLSTPARCLKYFKICNMLDRPSSSGFLCFFFSFSFFLFSNLQSSRGLHLKEEWATAVPRILCEMGWASTRSVGCLSEPVFTNHCCNLDSRETFVICLTFSVFNIRIFFN